MVPDSSKNRFHVNIKRHPLQLMTDETEPEPTGLVVVVGGGTCDLRLTWGGAVPVEQTDRAVVRGPWAPASAPLPVVSVEAGARTAHSI